jgi:DinB superfamily
MSATSQSVDVSEANQTLGAELRASRERFLRVIADVPERLEQTRLAPESWSILECAEHTCLAEHGMFAALERRRPTEDAPDTELNSEKDAFIQKAALDRSRKLDSPDPVRPTGRFSSLAEAAKEFGQARERTIAFIENLDEDLRRSTTKHPLGIVDSFQFVIIMARHPERHALQIEEIKNSPAYRAGLTS